MILSCIKSFEGRHFTASEVASMLSASEEPVGQATVYRMIDRLEHSGILRKYIIDGSTASCYQLVEQTLHDTSCREHFHLKCGNCGRLIHMDCDELTRISEHIKSEHGFSIDSSKTVFYGTCGECMPKEK